MNEPGPLRPQASLLTELLAAPRAASLRSRAPGLGPNYAARSHRSSCPEPEDAADSAPRFGYELELLGRLSATMAAEVIGETPEGYRINFTVTDGSVRGPRLDAIIQPGGRDHQCIRADGVGVADISITYQVNDGDLILHRSGGLCQLGTRCVARIRRGIFTGTAAFYATPTWSTASPKWNGLNSAQGVGIGHVVLDELQVEYDIYLPRLTSGVDT